MHCIICNCILYEHGDSLYVHCSLMYTLFTFCTSQLPSMSLWSSKDTAQISSPLSVDTVMIVHPHCGYTMGHWRVEKALALPSLVQCTLFKLEWNTPQPSLELTVYEHWMTTSSSVCMMIWATSSRAMQSSTLSFLLVSLELVRRLCMDVRSWYVYVSS